MTIIEKVKGLEGIQAKKNFLSNYSADTHAARLLAGGVGVNELLTLEYREAGAGVIDSYNGWRAKGRQVKKGAKALILYSSPVKDKRTHEEIRTERGNKIFAVAHVFAEADTEPI